jgi:hypothetical protein
MSGNETKCRNSEKIIRYFTQLTAATPWQLVNRVRLNFRTHHPQGLVKIGDVFYMSSVEVVRSPEKFSHPQDGYDRSPGEGVGHLFHFDSAGNLIKEITVSEGTIYHPGGIDYDGEHIWMPVAEYRPHSQSIIYRVAPETLDVSEMFRWHDHIGGLACNRWDDSLHGISWGSRKFYQWSSAGEGKMHVNGSHYIDYQDCHFLEEKYMLCSGLNAYSLPNIGWVSLGGLELVDLESHTAIHQIPVVLYSDTMRSMTQNPFSVELHHDHLRFYFIPDDHESTLYVYDALE